MASRIEKVSQYTVRQESEALLCSLIQRIKFLKIESTLADVVMVWQKHHLFAARFSEDSRGAGITQSAQCLS
jgi:hypothetical protein